MRIDLRGKCVVLPTFVFSCNCVYCIMYEDSLIEGDHVYLCGIVENLNLCVLSKLEF